MRISVNVKKTDIELPLFDHCVRRVRAATQGVSPGGKVFRGADQSAIMLLKKRAKRCPLVGAAQHTLELEDHHDPMSFSSIWSFRAWIPGRFSVAPEYAGGIRRIGETGHLMPQP